MECAKTQFDAMLDSKLTECHPGPRLLRCDINCTQPFVVPQFLCYLMHAKALWHRHPQCLHKCDSLSLMLGTARAVHWPILPEELCI